MDTFYRAFTGYRKETADDRECARDRKAVAAANAETDQIDSIRTFCTVDENWVAAVEEGLAHIEKAIAEMRQFIRTQGEVAPIESVKRVSKSSVEHLARHSDFITKIPENSEDLIPDKLYVVERLADFALYENRFLHMLLTYLKSFVGYRYTQIYELTHTLRLNLAADKTVSLSNRKLAFKLLLGDERRDDPFLKEDNPAREMLNRIDGLLKTVMHLLSTPLMQEVAKVPPLKPPIVKTNVLKMNLNFKGAVALYDYLTAYEGPGFTTEERRAEVSAPAEELSETVLLTAFLAYKEALGLGDGLAAAFEKEERRRKAEAERERLEEIAGLKQRIIKSGAGAEGYMLLLEERNAVLERDSRLLAAARAEIDALRAGAAVLTEKALTAEEAARQKENELAENARRYESEKAEAAARYAREQAELSARLAAESAAAVAALKEAQTAENARRDAAYAELSERSAADTARHQKELSDFAAALAAKTGAYNALYHEKTLSDARLKAYRVENGQIGAGEEYTEKETFDGLEREFTAFKAFFKSEWHKTKKKIKHKIYKGSQAADESGHGRKGERQPEQGK